VVRDPKTTSVQIAEFLGLPLNTDAMAHQVDGSLYRQRQKQDK